MLALACVIPTHLLSVGLGELPLVSGLCSGSAEDVSALRWLTPQGSHLLLGAAHPNLLASYRVLVPESEGSVAAGLEFLVQPSVTDFTEQQLAGKLCNCTAPKLPVLKPQEAGKC